MDYLAHFTNPPHKFRGAPFWAWNCKLDPEKMAGQIEYFDEMGLGGFTMHSRTGLDTQYLSEEYFAAVTACIEKAREKGMHVRLYDEDRWPSGAAGGYVTQDEQFRARYLVFTPFKSGESCETVELDGGAYGEVKGSGKLLGRYRVVLKDGCLAHYERLADDAPEEQGLWYAYLEISPTSPWFNNLTYVNTLDKKAIERFVQVTHEEYFKRYGQDFGGLIPSIFTDEPQFSLKQRLGRAEDKKPLVLPYTDDLDETFTTAYGRSLLDGLPELIWELPEGEASPLRYYYHDHVSERFSEAFFDTIGNWCAAHNIMLTGHMMAEAELDSQTRALGEVMRTFRGFGMPGIDMLCDSREYNTAKQAQSAAHQKGASDVTSELYGVTNWTFDFRGHKLQGDWQAALGVTHRVHHLSWASMAGEAKRDYPASIFYQSPWYKEYRRVEDHFARVNTALQSGKPVVKVGVIHPVESYWLLFGPEEQTAEKRAQLETRFEQLTQWLLFGMVDFDFISESLTLAFDNEDKEGFGVGEMQYDVVVVPGSLTLRGTTLDRLEAFAAKGGRIIVLGQDATYVDALPSSRPAQLKSEHVLFEENAVLRALEPQRMVDMRDSRGKRATSYLHQLRDNNGELLLFVANGKKPDSGDVPYYTHEKKYNNPDVPTPEKYTFTVAGCWQPQLMDTLTGQQRPLAARHSGGKTLFDYTMYEHDSLLVRLVPASEPSDIPQERGLTTIPFAVLTDVAGYSTSEPNVLLLDQAAYAIDDAPLRPAEEILRIDHALRNELGYPLRKKACAQPWTLTQLAGNEHTLRLVYNFDSEEAVLDAELAMEYGADTEILLNGTQVANKPQGWFVDECIQRVPLPGIRAGENTLELRVPYGPLANPEWCYLLGSFGVALQGNKANLTRKPRKVGFGDLTPQGFPFFAGNFTYKIEVDLPQGEYELAATKYRAPLLAVAVDGKRKGVISYSPYRVGLGTLEGKHTLEVTAFGNRANAFGAVHNSDGATCWFGNDAWRTDGDSFAYEYQLTRFGILSAPVLYKLK